MKLALTARLMLRLRFCVSSLPVLKTKLSPITSHILSTRHVQLSHASFTASSGYFDYENELDGAQEGQDEEISSLEHDIFGQTQSIRNLLYPNTTDSLLLTLNKCASVQELFSVIENHKVQFTCKHVTQAVLVLWDLQRVFNQFHFTNSIFDVQKLDDLNRDYLDKLCENATFLGILNFIDTNMEEFDLEQLSSIMLYLNKMGLAIKHKLLQKLIEQFKIKLKNHKDECCLMLLSQFVASVLKSKDLSYYYHVQDIVPTVFNRISKVKSAEEFRHLTLCLNGLKHFITEEVMSMYKVKARDLMEQKEMTGKNFDVILRVISFLSYNEWKDANTILTSKLIMLLKTYLHLLSVQDLLKLYEVISKIQEPADILNEAQRCASKFFLQLEEEAAPIDIRLQLLLCVASFSSPSQRLHVEKLIRKYMDYDLSPLSLLHLYKVILFNKTTDAWIYKTFWKKTLNSLNNEAFRKANLLKISNNYITFNQDVNLHRCREFEDQILDWLETEIENEGIDTLKKSRFCVIASFVLIYSQKKEVLRHCIKKIEQNIEQFNHIDCHNLSRSLEIATDIVKNRQLEVDAAEKIKSLLDLCTFKNLRKGLGFHAKNLLFKSYIYRHSSGKELLNALCGGYDEDQNLSSILIKNICFCLYSTNTMLPDLLDRMTDYVMRHEDHVAAFSAERLIYLCFCLGHLPKNSKQFFHVIINIILRDQERLNGLAYLHTCLSLCYFHALPQSLIRHVFNVEFLEKLDAELLNCYFKNTYPLRVRRNLFYLNRAVCLDYPECNVPWFHQKYVDTTGIKTSSKSSNRIFLDYLLKICRSDQYITQNEVTPYGYNVDFVIHLDAKNEIVLPDHAVQKIGILLMPPKAYTNINVQLKGRYQLQIRHLEILGYKIIAVNRAQWTDLLYGEDKINYLSNMIWPETLKENINR